MNCEYEVQSVKIHACSTAKKEQLRRGAFRAFSEIRVIDSIHCRSVNALSKIVQGGASSPSGTSPFFISHALISLI